MKNVRMYKIVKNKYKKVILSNHEVSVSDLKGLTIENETMLRKKRKFIRYINMSETIIRRIEKFIRKKEC